MFVNAAFDNVFTLVEVHPKTMNYERQGSEITKQCPRGEAGVGMSRKSYILKR